MAKRPDKYRVGRYMGNDIYSWAVFAVGDREPVVSGLSRREAQYHKRQIEERLKEKR